MRCTQIRLRRLSGVASLPSCVRSLGRPERRSGRTLRAFVMLMLALPLGACGEKLAPSSGDKPARSSRERSAPASGEARATVERYFAALARGDAAAMCREMSARARSDAASLARVSSCVEAGRIIAISTQPELLRNLALMRLGRVEVNGRKATVQVTGDDTYASEKRTVTVPLEAHDGRWVIERLTSPDNSADPVTTCVVGGFEALDNGNVDKFWTREGRPYYPAYISRVCKRANAAGVLGRSSGDVSAKNRKALERIASNVVEEMVRDGVIERP